MSGEEHIKLVAPLIWRIQHSSGSHEQDRWDAMAWLELVRPEGYSRCTCSKCLKLWTKKPALADTGSRIGLALKAAES